MTFNLDRLLAAVILAGGRSTRMGTNKALVKIKGREMLLWVVEGLKPVTHEIIVSAKDESVDEYRRIVGEDVKIATDLVQMDGPLVGIYSALLKSSSEYAYVHPIDSPIINHDIIRYLLQKADGYDASVIKFDDSIEPLHAIYRVRAALNVAKSILEQGESGAKSLVGKLRVNYIPVDDLRRFDQGLVSLLNVNTPEGLARISAFLD
jgi:molybdopterin-guanine dinucleotide biosynthesis protein A